MVEQLKSALGKVATSDYWAVILLAEIDRAEKGGACVEFMREWVEVVRHAGNAKHSRTPLKIMIIVGNAGFISASWRIRNKTNCKKLGRTAGCWIKNSSPAGECRAAV